MTSTCRDSGEPGRPTPFGVCGLGFWMLRIYGYRLFGFRISDFGFMVSGLGFPASSFGFDKSELSIFFVRGAVCSRL